MKCRPFTRQSKGDKAKLVAREMEHAHTEYDEIREFLKKLSGMSAPDEGWIELFGEFKRSASHHVRDEEGDVFESAKKYLSDEEASQIGKGKNALKKDARPRMAAPPSLRADA